MSNEARQQISAIHTMLAVGHRNLRMERHTLLLWGIAGGVLFALSDQILTQTQIPNVNERAVAWLSLLALVFGGIAAIDWYLTREVKASRDEVWSFIHRQIIKIWWMIIAIGTLLTFATFFFGGGYMLCSAWIVLFGLGLFIHGLFSDEMLEWAGAGTLLVGILSLSFNFPYESMKWIAASIFGIGMPLLSLLINRPVEGWKKVSQLLIWLLVVVVPPLLVERYLTARVPQTDTISLADYQRLTPTKAPQIVSIPAGTTVPVQIQISGDVFRNSQQLELPLKLDKSIEIVMEDGQPTRKVRFSGDDWQNSNEAGWFRIPWIRGQIGKESGPSLSTKFDINLHRH